MITIGNNMMIKRKASSTLPDHIVGIKIDDNSMIWSTDGFATYTTRNKVSEPIQRVQGNGKGVLAYFEGNPQDSSRLWYYTIDYGQTWNTTTAPGHASYSQTSVDFMASDTGQYMITSGGNQSGSLQWARYTTNYGSSWTNIPTSLMHKSTWGQGGVSISADGQYSVHSQRSDLCHRGYNYLANWNKLTVTTNDGTGKTMTSPNGQYQLIQQGGSWTPYYVFYSSNYGATWSSFSCGSNTSQRPYYLYVTNTGFKQFYWSGKLQRYTWNGSTFVVDTTYPGFIGPVSDDDETYNIVASTDFGSPSIYKINVDNIDTGMTTFSWLYGIAPFREGSAVFFVDSSNNIQLTTNGGQSWSVVRNLGVTPAHVMFTNYGKVRN